jgi:predicted metal-dependent hydrolase
MKREIVLNGQTIVYTVRHNSRARHLRMVIDPDDGLIVTVPGPWFERFVDHFLRQKTTWILKHLARMKKMEGRTVIRLTREEYEKNKKAFLMLIVKRVEFFNTLYGFTYKKISIRNQTSLWGSCTHAGNLQFNYKLSHVPPRTIDYVVVHELCHLRQHNHGARFWKLVAKTFPDYEKIRKSLHMYVMKEG